MKKPSELTDDESTKLFDSAKPFLNQINVTGSTEFPERLRLFMAARFIDVRCRVDGHEYFFEGEEIRHYINELQKKANKKKWWQRKTTYGGPR